MTQDSSAQDANAISESHDRSTAPGNPARRDFLKAGSALGTGLILLRVSGAAGQQTTDSPPGGVDAPDTDAPDAAQPAVAADTSLSCNGIGAFFSPTDPGSREELHYDRHGTVFWTDDHNSWSGSKSFVWTWCFSVGSHVPFGADVSPKLRMLLNGAPATDWLQPATNKYPFVLQNVADGNYIVGFEGLPDYVWLLAKPLLVNASGKALLQQQPWTAQKRFDVTNRVMSLGFAQVTAFKDFKVPQPRQFPMKARPAPSFNGLFVPKRAVQNLPDGTSVIAGRWVRDLDMNTTESFVRRKVWMPNGLDLGVLDDSKYFYDDATLIGNAYLGLVTPNITLRDGPPGVGCLGFTYKFILRRGGKGAYFADTVGRLGFKNFDAFTNTDGADLSLSIFDPRERAISTIAGWRLKRDDLAVHLGVLDPIYLYGHGGPGPYRKQDVDLYDSKWEYCGDFSRLPSWLQRVHAPWGFCVGMKKKDGSIDTYDGNEYWWPATEQNALLYVNGWTGHPFFYPPGGATLPPAGYKAPSAPTGAAQVALFLANPDGTPNPSKYLNKPWDCAIRPQDGKLYWTNYLGNSICRCNLDGSNPQVVIASSVNPTDVQLGIPAYLVGSAMKPGDLRDMFVVDGAVGKASCVRPQGIAFDSDGNLVWGERYTFVVRRYDFKTGLVSTVARIGADGGDNDKADVALAIDVEGTVGPQDDIFVMCWKNGDFRYAKDGTFRERPAYASGQYMTSGPQSFCGGPNYAWGIGIAPDQGRYIMAGGAGAWQFNEVTLRQPGDPEPDVRKYMRGKHAYNRGAYPPMSLLHGPDGRGELGYPRYEEWGSWDDTKLRAYALANGIPPASITCYNVKEGDTATVNGTTFTFSHGPEAPTDIPISPCGDIVTAEAFANAVNAAKLGVAATTVDARVNIGPDGKATVSSSNDTRLEAFTIEDWIYWVRFETLAYDYGG